MDAPALTGLDAVRTLRRIECSSDSDAVTLFWFEGQAFSRCAGEADRLLFGVEGMLIRASSTIHDDQRGEGFHRVGREMMVVTDPATGEIVDEWANPWTGETNAVVHVANDHVNARYLERAADGSPFSLPLRFIGPHWQYRQMLPIWRGNPLGAGFDAEAGGMYHASELFTFSGQSSDLDDLSRRSAEVAVSWSRLSDWYPWMHMRGRPGLIYVQTTGAKLSGWPTMPARLTHLINTRFSAFREPPPAGDSAPMDTSWTEYRRIRETGVHWYRARG